MKANGLLALTLLLAFSALHAEDAGLNGALNGKWTAGAESNSGPGGGGGGGSMSASCVQRRDPWDPLGTLPRQPCRDTFGGARWRPAELNLKVDAPNGTMTGFVVFPAIGGLRPMMGGNDCGKLKIEEGRITGRSLSFTTYRSVNGSRIPARWIGEMTSAGALTIKTFDTLPCSAGGGGTLSPLTGRPLTISERPFPEDVRDRVLIYQRGKAQANPSGLSGKWWTTDSGVLSALDLKVGDKGKLGGSANVCGNSEFKIEEGSIVGRAVRFTTHRKVGKLKVSQTWSGDLVNDGTLRLASPIATQCQFSTSTTLTFLRSR